MNAVLTTLLEMSFAASILILVVIALRVFCKKLPRWTFCLFWGLVAIRLMVPFTFESHLSLMPSADKYHITIEEAELPEVPTFGAPTIPQTELQPSEQMEPQMDRIQERVDLTEWHEAVKELPTASGAETSSDLMQIQESQPAQETSAFMQFLKSLTVSEVLMILWLTGMISILIYAGISSVRLHRKVAEAICIRDNIWICDQVTTPFILGVIRPRILLPSSIKEDELAYILTHEETHLRRKDPLWKILGFLVLAIHWYNPLVWLAYSMFCKDMEYACDEASVKQYDLSGRKAYSSALLTYSIQRKNLVVYPIAFGRISAKERVRMVLQYKKKAIIWSVLAVMLIIVMAVCFLTKPMSKQQEADPVESETEISSEVEEENSEVEEETNSVVVEEENSEDSVYEPHQYIFSNPAEGLTLNVVDPATLTLKETGYGYNLDEYLDQPEEIVIEALKTAGIEVEEIRDELAYGVAFSGPFKFYSFTTTLTGLKCENNLRFVCYGDDYTYRLADYYQSVTYDHAPSAEQGAELQRMVNSLNDVYGVSLSYESFDEYANLYEKIDSLAQRSVLWRNDHAQVWFDTMYSTETDTTGMHLQMTSWYEEQLRKNWDDYRNTRNMLGKTGDRAYSWEGLIGYDWDYVKAYLDFYRVGYRRVQHDPIMNADVYEVSDTSNGMPLTIHLYFTVDSRLDRWTLVQVEEIYEAEDQPDETAKTAMGVIYQQYIDRYGEPDGYMTEDFLNKSEEVQYASWLWEDSQILIEVLPAESEKTWPTPFTFKISYGSKVAEKYARADMDLSEIPLSELGLDFTEWISAEGEPLVRDAILEQLNFDNPERAKEDPDEHSYYKNIYIMKEEILGKEALTNIEFSPEGNLWYCRKFFQFSKNEVEDMVRIEQKVYEILNESCAGYRRFEVAGNKLVCDWQSQNENIMICISFVQKEFINNIAPEEIKEDTEYVMVLNWRLRNEAQDGTELKPVSDIPELTIE